MQYAIPKGLRIGWEWALCVGVQLVPLPVVCNTYNHTLVSPQLSMVDSSTASLHIQPHIADTVTTHLLQVL